MGVPDLDNIDKVNLKRRLRYQQNIRDALRKRFRDEYLGQLIMRPTKNKAKQRVVVGDIVLIENEGTLAFGKSDSNIRRKRWQRQNSSSKNCFW
ncbi:hypothetical protein JTE90_008942 [Oedothorax gibbosus]|uniref:DUF5641 domain-containing protein n=1 Tax=Oedothorax gibbosus TaxID=931172 RepID=A0AAV6UNJ3_9ARAC|nr:hypothetical protein JTE90_008942 [Oedothorax gibbosus]